MAAFESFDTVSRRLRVVHSCDQCRARKIKCVIGPGQTACSTCLKQRVNCTFAARDEYLAKRERNVANQISASGSVAATSGTLGQLSVISFSPFTPTASSATVNSPSAQSVLLAGSDQPEYPATIWMPHFIELFFKYYGDSFPFLSYEGVVTSFLQSTLSSVLANAIASLASHYSQSMSELVSVDTATAPEYYAYQAKRILRSVVHVPSVDTLSGIVLIAFYESQARRTDSFDYYAQVAASMTRSLNLFDENILVALSHGPAERQQLVILRSIATGLHRLKR